MLSSKDLSSLRTKPTSNSATTPSTSLLLVGISKLPSISSSSSSSKKSTSPVKIALSLSKSPQDLLMENLPSLPAIPPLTSSTLRSLMKDFWARSSNGLPTGSSIALLSWTTWTRPSLLKSSLAFKLPLTNSLTTLTINKKSQALTSLSVFSQLLLLKSTLNTSLLPWMVRSMLPQREEETPLLNPMSLSQSPKMMKISKSLSAIMSSRLALMLSTATVI
mmetsp:Transcript_1893/g.1780  ORF Transcript_1893/g.1780 Transcript_1893/m.1780 type:complete len:220 (+) Transcript_1893:326-985(+)